MWILLIRLAVSLWRKLVPLALVIFMVVVGAGIYLYGRDHLNLELDRARQLEVLEATEERLIGLREEARDRVERLRTEVEAVREQYRRAERLLEQLQAFRGFWENLFRSREDREREMKRMLWAENKKQETALLLQDLLLQMAAAEKTYQNLEERFLEVQRERQELRDGESEALSYAWQGWLAVKKPLIIGAAFFLAGPSLWKIFCFYLWAPFIGLGKPIRLREGAWEEVLASPSQVSKRVAVKPGERVVLKEKFLQASDEDLKRRTRFVFDWRIPFSSAACGLIELTEMINRGEADLSVTFSTQEEPMTELSVIEIPVGGALVLRPSHLAGVLGAADERLRIDRHWRIFSIHAWVTLQFRYFEFHGPCQLIVCGKRGVRAEFLRPREGEKAWARRTNQDSTIGFTPDLIYHSVRAETFWAYYRGRNPLFDDLFRGTSGAFVCQEISSRGGAFTVRRFWSGFWGAVLKVFGL